MNRTDAAIAAKGYARPEVLVSTQWVAEHLDDPQVRVLECDEDVLLYDVGHVPGAQKLDWHEDLNDATVRNGPIRSVETKTASTARVMAMLEPSIADQPSGVRGGCQLAVASANTDMRALAGVRDIALGSTRGTTAVRSTLCDFDSTSTPSAAG